MGVNPCKTNLFPLNNLQLLVSQDNSFPSPCKVASPKPYMLLNPSSSLHFWFNLVHSFTSHLHKQVIHSLVHSLLSHCREVSPNNMSPTKCLHIKFLLHSMHIFHMEVCSFIRPSFSLFNNREDQSFFPNMCTNQEYHSPGLISLCLHREVSSIAIFTRLQHKAVLNRL